MIRLFLSLIVFAVSTCRIITVPNEWFTILAWVGIVTSAIIVAWVMSDKGFCFGIEEQE